MSVMLPMTSAPRYGRVARILHWTIAILILVAIPLGLICGSIGQKAADPRLAELRSVLLFWHKSIGVTVLVLAVARILWRLGHKPPVLPAHMPNGERILAKAVHGLLYLVMVGMPISGIMLTQATGFPVRWFGLWTLPDMVRPDRTIPMMQRIEVKLSLILHERIFAYTLFAVLALHIAGLLKHHFIDRDPSIWRRMAPWRTPEAETEAPLAHEFAKVRRSRGNQ
jgi:cytochrome b561